MSFDTLVVRGAREHNLQERQRRAAPRPADRVHRPVRVGQVAAWRSTRSTPRASGATSSRCRPTPGSSSGRWTSPTSTSSRGCRRPSRSTRSRPRRNPRSTVGTITEVYDYLRLLYARIGVPHCPERRRPRSAPDAAADRRPAGLQLPDGTRFQVLAPVVRGRKGEYETLLEDLQARATSGPGSTARRSRHRRVPEGRRTPGPLRAAHDRGRRRPAGASARASSAG